MDQHTSQNDPRHLREREAFRKKKAQDIKMVRERLAQGTPIKPNFEYELLTMFAKNELGAAVTMPALSILFSLAALFWATAWEAAIWLLLVIGAKVILLEQAHKLLLLPSSEVNVKQWRQRFTRLEFINGMTWAGFALVGIGADLSGNSPNVYSSHVFIFATLIVLLSIRMTFASSILPILHAGTIPMTIAVVFRLCLLGDPFYYALAAMALGVHIYFVFLAKGLDSTTHAMLAFRAQKDALIAELEEEKAISDEARRRAEAANRAKSRFLATMSHELRTPLNAIMGFAEVMKSELLGPMSNKVYKEYAESIHESGGHLLQLINEILDLSRIEAGRYDLHEEPVFLADIAEECHRLLKLRAQKKELEIIEAYSEDLPPIWADVRAMRQICLNLLSNALKFTPQNGRILMTVKATPDGGQLLSIRDTGPGIPKEEIPKVLQAFGQGSLAHQSAEGGTGLGLPIVKNLIELHGGHFYLRSQLRKGTEGIITIPPERVMKTVSPAQPLGEERHRSDIESHPVRSASANHAKAATA